MFSLKELKGYFMQTVYCNMLLNCKSHYETLLMHWNYCSHFNNQHLSSEFIIITMYCTKLQRKVVTVTFLHNAEPCNQHGDTHGYYYVFFFSSLVPTQLYWGKPQPSCYHASPPPSVLQFMPARHLWPPTSYSRSLTTEKWHSPH